MQGRRRWVSIVLMILPIHSTVYSGLWLLVAIARPRYGKRTSFTGSLPPSTASLLCAAFAKSIELSFVTIFVAFLGQALSRRALVKISKGITVAEMTMRNWVMQPGNILTHGECICSAGITFLGVVSLLAAFMAMIFTTASNALGMTLALHVWFP